MMNIDGKIFKFILITSIWLNIIFLNNILAEDINPFSENSPIKETFDNRIVVWRFDDMWIQSPQSRIDKFVRMSDAITKHGGYVGWGFIPAHNKTCTNYDPPGNRTYSQEKIDMFHELTSDDKVSLWMHDWNHSFWYGTYGPSVWTKSLKEQREALNYTIWTFENNFGYYPKVFSAGGNKGNVNTTVVLAERDILLLYGNSNYEPPDHRLRYLTLPSSDDSVLCSLDFYDHENILEDMKETFTNNYNKDNICVLQIMLHPYGWNETTIPIFAEFTEWVYNNHDLIKMNYTDAYNYKHDLECLLLDKQNDVMYTLNFYGAFNPLEITWSKLGDWIVEYAHNQTRYGDLNVSTFSDNIMLEPGYEYTIRSASSTINTNDDSNEDQNNPITFTNIAVFLLIIIIVIYSLFKSVNKRK